jgi:secreted trypsin-like serine protease
MKVTLAGYGEIDGRQHLGAKGLNKVQVTIADPNFAPSEVMMDQRNGKGACHGDSGGPAYATGANGQLFLFGATSRLVNDPNNTCGVYTVFSKLQSAAMMKFINDAVTDLLKPKGKTLRSGIWNI